MYNKMDDTYSLIWAKKIKAVDLLGGKCEKCGIDNIFVLEFHHNIIGKEKSINKFRSYRWSVIREEIKKCSLLCANCHSEFHSNNGRGSKKKTIFLQFSGKTKCSRCGYSGDNLSSLSFHHTNGTSKKFGITKAFSRAGTISLEQFLNEITKCEIICKNCHCLFHNDESRFNRLKELIYNKVENYTEQKRLDKKKIKFLKEKGLGVCAISKEVGANKSSVSYVFNRI